MSKVLLIDGSNYLFRAYHALPPLSNSRGEPTHAIYGFLNMLHKVWGLTQPTYAGIVFDASGKNFRHRIFPEYKANRPPMPDDLRVQIAPLLRLLPTLGWPVIQVPGVEADDVLATLALRAQLQDIPTVIATGDKDMAQLVNEHVTLLNTMNNKFYDRAGVYEKYNVYPEQIIDYLALMGDKVDNVPGIQKCGPVTASKWLHTYGTMDGIIAAAPTIKGKIGEYLREGLPFLRTARRLVTIKTDCRVPTVPDFNALLLRQARESDIRSLSERLEMGFHTLSRVARGGIIRLGEEPAKPQAKPATPIAARQQGSLFALDSEVSTKDQLSTKQDTPRLTIDEPRLIMPQARPAIPPTRPDDVPYTLYTLARAPKLLESLLAYQAPRPIAIRYWVDRENGDDWVALGFSRQPLKNDIVALELGEKEEFFRLFAPFFASDLPKVFHEAKNALHDFTRAGVTINGLLDDTHIMSYVYEAHLSHDFTSLVGRHTTRLIASDEELFGKGKKRLTTRAYTSQEPLWAQTLADEVASLRALWSVFHLRLRLDSPLRTIYETIERPLIRVLATMEDNGVYVDTVRLAEQSQALGDKITALEKEIYAMAGHEFNIASPAQLGKVLFEEMGLPAKKKTAKGVPSTAEEVLTELALDFPIVERILDFRRFSKLKGTYLDALPKLIAADGRIHTTFGQATAVTGRLTSTNPNLQNIPVRTEEGRAIRSCFSATEGNVIISADYSQIELRIMAHLSQDATLLKAFARGKDIHRATASEIVGRPVERITADERRMAKVINFGLIYGMSAFGVAQNLGIDRNVAKSYIDRYFMRYPGVQRYMTQSRTKAQESYHVETHFGRRLWLPDMQSSRPMVRAGAERAAINAPLQGTAADLIKLAMIRVDEWLREQKLSTRLILQVHDELILEVPTHEIECVKENLPKIMREVAQLSVPLIAEVGVGPNWEEAH